MSPLTPHAPPPTAPGARRPGLAPGYCSARRRRLDLRPADRRWISRAPELEEDVALANIGLDLLGQARSLLAHAGRLEGEGRGEDDLAYLRDERDFRYVHLVERVQTDFGVAMARLLVFATYQAELYAALLGSTDETLAGVAGKAVKEVAYHVDHATPLGAAARRRDAGVPRADAARPRRGVAVRRGALRAGRRHARGRAASPPTPRSCAPPCSSASRPWSPRRP